MLARSAVQHVGSRLDPRATNSRRQVQGSRCRAIPPAWRRWAGKSCPRAERCRTGHHCDWGCAPHAASCSQASTTPRRPPLASSRCARSQDRGDVILRAFAGGPVGSDRSQFAGQSGAHKKRRPTNRRPSQEYQALHGSLRSFLVQSDGRPKASSACNFKEARSRSPPQVVPQCPLSPGIGPVLRKCMLWANVVIT